MAYYLTFSNAWQCRWFCTLQGNRNIVYFRVNSRRLNNVATARCTVFKNQHKFSISDNNVGRMRLTYSLIHWVDALRPKLSSGTLQFHKRLLIK